MKFKYALLIIITLSLESCNKYLDIIPKDKFMPVTVEDYENMLNNGFLIYYGDYNQDLLTDDVFFPEEQPGNLYNKQSLPAKRIFTFSTHVFDEGEYDFQWAEGYKRLFYFNSVINNIMEATGKTPAYKESLKAEALLGRAMELLQLVNLYAHHYDAATAAKEPGIPIALVADISAKFSRNSVEEVYQQILLDVTTALPNLPLKHKNTRFRASKAAGHALLSRTYLFMGDYDKALEQAQLALALQGELVDMNNYSVIAPGPFPFVPGTPIGWTDIPDAQNHPEAILARTFLRPFGLGMDVCASKDLTALFNNDDCRWTLYFANGWPPAPPFNYMDIYQVKIFLRGDFFNNALAVPELYLITAEAKARAEDLDGALNAVNTLRKNRINPNVYVAKTKQDFNNDPDEVLRFVLEERRRELVFTGMRHIDLKRLNKDPRFQKTIVHKVEGKEYTLLPNSDAYLRQIWAGASVFNPDWPLNP